jgi:hypothetical protein
MKGKFKLIGIIAGAFLALFWGALGILQASDFQFLSFGFLDFFAKPHHNAAWQELLFKVWVISTYPLFVVPQPTWIPDNWFTMFVYSLLDSIIWGVGLAFLFYGIKYGVKHGFHRHVA